MLTDNVKELVVDDNVDGLRMRGELRESRVGGVVFQQTDDVSGDNERLTTCVKVDGGERPRPELRRAAEQRLSTRLCRQVEQNDRAVLSRTDQLILHTTSHPIHQALLNLPLWFIHDD